MLNADKLKMLFGKREEESGKSTLTLHERRHGSLAGGFQRDTVINSRFKIHSVLKAGGMGMVYRAVDQRLDVDVVIKFVLPQYASEDDFTARFEREARYLAKVNHPNVVMVYEYGAYEEEPFIAMAYVEGNSLRELLDQNENFSVPRVLDVGLQLCDGLGQAHRVGLIHRDIKPSNLLVDKRERVTIIDFGIARMEGTAQRTMPGIQPGTMEYMSPEQSRGEKLDQRSDIFSAGIVLYELLAGQRPFEKQYDDAKREALEKRAPEPLIKYNPNTTTGLQRIIDKALEKEAARRYQQIEEMWRDLKAEQEHPTPIASLPKAAAAIFESTQLRQTPADLPAALQNPTFESPEDIVAAESRFYIEREGDRAIMEEVSLAGRTIILLGPQKIGKSCLLARLNAFAPRIGKRFAWVNFRDVDQETLGEANAFYRRFCALIAEALGLPDRLDEHWAESGVSLNFRCSQYVSRYILETVQTPVILALDDVDRVFAATTAVRNNFFSMLRAWHSDRARKPIWKQLDLILVSAAEPNYFIQSKEQSPFNVGRSVELADFLPEQVAELNRRHGTLWNEKEIAALFTLVGGHPYLVRLALYQVATKTYTPTALFDQTSDDQGPFGEHLQRLWRQISKEPQLVTGLREIIRQRTCADPEIFYRLHAMGLVVRRQKNIIVPRCKLYSSYFPERLNE